jgi:hypothetical protein
MDAEPMTQQHQGLSQAGKNILNLLLVQAVWFACVMGGTLWGWAAALVFFGLYQRMVGNLQKDWLCIMVIATTGFGVDCTISSLELMIFPENNLLPFLPLPGWMAALWLTFATLFLHGLQWLRHRPLLAAAAGAFLGPASYYAGAQLHGVKLGMILQSFWLCYGLLWAIMMPLFGGIARSLARE